MKDIIVKERFDLAMMNARYCAVTVTHECAVQLRSLTMVSPETPSLKRIQT